MKMKLLNKPNLVGFDITECISYLSSINQPSFRAKQISKWLYQKNVETIDLMTNLPLNLKSQLKEDFTLNTLMPLCELKSRDSTIKWIFNLQNKTKANEVISYSQIETVYIPKDNRATLCISSQAGCALACTFCATGKRGFERNLTSSEIIGQVLYAKNKVAKLGLHPITNIVYMGMGEPLANVGPVFSSLKLLLDDNAFGFSRHKVTLSTSGIIPNIKKLIYLNLGISLAISLHAPNDELRSTLVPINKKFPIAKLLSACWDYCESQKVKYVTMEYVMLKDINDKKEHAKQLIELFKGKPVKINLIPFNSFASSGYQRSSEARINEFMHELRSNAVFTTVRETRGDDTSSACGQLTGVATVANFYATPSTATSL